jgi:hypothetical protein
MLKHNLRVELNAVFLKRYGWYRIDARGNKPGVEAAFCPPIEKLAFPIVTDEKTDLPEIWAEPLGVVIKALTENVAKERPPAASGGVRNATISPRDRSRGAFSRTTLLF